MKPQVIQDHNGNPTGVFIPIKEWEEIKKQYPGIEDNQSFELSLEQKKILDERLKADKQDFIPARKALNNLREKYCL